jgi:hypothetical protein
VNAYVLGHLQAMHKCLIFRHIVRCSKVHLQNISQLVILGLSKNYACTQTMYCLGPIKMHSPIICIWQRWLILYLSPINEEIGQHLGLDRIPLIILGCIW